MSTDDDGCLVIEMGVTEGKHDIDTHHGFALHWLATNWDALMTGIQIAYTKHRESQKIQDVEIKTPKPRLLAADGQSLLQQ